MRGRHSRAARYGSLGAFVGSLIGTVAALPSLYSLLFLLGAWLSWIAAMYSANSR